MLLQTVQTDCFGHQARPQPGPPPTSDHALLDAVELLGFVMSYPRRKEIYGAEEKAKYVYKVLSGAVQTYKMLEDGRRKIVAFYMPGDVIGLETPDNHVLSAEAVTLSKLLLVRRSTLVALAAHDNDVARQLWTLVAAELRRVQDHILLLTRPAEERVAGFLVDMAQRYSTNDEVELPMGRQDIADYLGLTIETVSRSFTNLTMTAAIKLPTRRRIVLRNYSALARQSA